MKQSQLIGLYKEHAASQLLQQSLIDNPKSKIHFKGLFRIRYRGKTDYNKRYFRDPRHCLQKYATSFAIYPIESKWDEIYKTIIGEK